PIASLLQAAALMFVAYTGYGRIATLGEEVKEPRRTIPRAIALTMLVTCLLYISIAVVTVVVGQEVINKLSTADVSLAAPLEVIARVGGLGVPVIPKLIAIGAVTAMLGVLLNLILGLSRVLLAMGRRRDVPKIVARLNSEQTTPYIAVIVVGVAIAFLVLIGDVKTTWSFSAFNVLIYYAITNFAALKLSAEERLYPKWLGWVGLAACLFLAFWVEQQIWLVGLGLILVGLIWHSLIHRLIN
ncbi:MAG: amino acid permease, partial [Okeania sp. SIO3C4]|nr:amino acid permease [Okeania sp. SIO3C4]